MEAVVILAQWPGHMTGWGPGWMWLWMVLFWAAVIGAIVYAARSSSARQDSARGARDILADRFAAGDIGTDEYRDRLKVLEGHSSGGTRS